MMPSDLPISWVPDVNEVAAQRVRRGVQHHDLPTTGMGTEIPNLVQHYQARAMAGPAALGRAFNGEMDPTSDEGIHSALSIALGQLGTQSPFAMRSSLGAGGGKMVQRPPRPPVTHEGPTSSWIPPQSEATPLGLPFEPTGDIVAKVPEMDTAPKQEGLQRVLQSIWRKTTRDHGFGEPYIGKQ
jgi:hypothetical protein